MTWEQWSDFFMWVFFLAGIVTYILCLVKVKAAFLPIVFLIAMGAAATFDLMYVIRVIDDPFDELRVTMRYLVVVPWFLSAIGFFLFIKRHSNGNGH